MTRFAHGSSCDYVCDMGYGANVGGIAEVRGSAASNGKFTCQQGTWVLDKPGSCVITTCDTGGAYTQYECRASEMHAWATPSGEPPFGTECKVKCPLGGEEVIQLCNVTADNPGGAPVMAAVGTADCPTTTTTTTTLAPTTAKVTTTEVAAKVYITHSISFEQDFPEGTTAETLLADKSFTASVKTGLVDAVSAGIPELEGQIDESNIEDLKFTLVDPAAPARRLAVKKLTVDYSILLPPTVTTSPEALGATLVSNKAAFESTMTKSYAAAYEANTGKAPEGFTGVVASEEVGTKIVTVPPAGAVTTPAPAPPPPTTPEADPTPAPAPASAPASPAEEEEEDDNTGTIVGASVGGIAGAGALGGAFYMIKKKQASE